MKRNKRKDQHAIMVDTETHNNLKFFSYYYNVTIGHLIKQFLNEHKTQIDIESIKREFLKHI